LNDLLTKEEFLTKILLVGCFYGGAKWLVVNFHFKLHLFLSFGLFFSIPLLCQSVEGKCNETSLLSNQIYYVRPDGGTSSQCTGVVDSPYPGSGENQPCAWSHPFYAINQDGNWILKGGDTLFIHQGSYKMGYGGGELPTTLCSSDYTWDCHLPPLPGGPDSSHPTRIVGEGYDGNCITAPELWGAERAISIIDLTNSSNVEINCLELTDHSSCASYHCNSTVACQRDNYPYGDYADNGIEAPNSSNLVLKNLYIHGLAMEGIHAGGINNLTMENVILSGNGFAGWDGDIGEGSSFSGNINLKNLLVEWSGCPEQYPSKQPSFVGDRTPVADMEMALEWQGQEGIGILRIAHSDTMSLTVLTFFMWA